MSSAPIEAPANSQPSELAECSKRVSESCGNTACGQPNVIAMMSTTKVMSSTGFVRRKAKPSPTPRTAARSRSAAASRPGGREGSPRSSSTAMTNPQASMA